MCGIFYYEIFVPYILTLKQTELPNKKNENSVNLNVSHLDWTYTSVCAIWMYWTVSSQPKLIFLFSFINQIFSQTVVSVSNFIDFFFIHYSHSLKKTVAPNMLSLYKEKSSICYSLFKSTKSSTIWRNCQLSLLFV